MSTIAHLLDISADEGRGKSRWEQGQESREAEVEFHCPASPGSPVLAWTLPRQPRFMAQAWDKLGQAWAKIGKLAPSLTQDCVL